MKSIILTFILLSNSVFAQQPPTGVYVSGGPTTPMNSSVKASNANFSFVSGVLVRLNWKDLEPTDDAFDWTLIENQIDSANHYGVQISLAVGAGDNLPDWLLPQIETYSFNFMGDVATRAVPWDAAFLSEWSEFVLALGNKFDGVPTISMVYITNASANGFEMQLPSGAVVPDWSTLGYSETSIINSWKTVIDAFDEGFPNSFLSNDFHPILGSNTPADSIYNYASTTIGGRYGASAWWWSQHNTTVYPSQFDLLQNSASNSFATVQVARSGTQDSALLGAGGLYGALQTAKDVGICYWEIWEQDIVNTNFHPLFDTIACSSTSTGVETGLNEKSSELIIRTNPSANYLTIETEMETPYVASIYNLMGQVVKTVNATEEESIQIGLNELSVGNYIVTLINPSESAVGRFVKF